MQRRALVLNVLLGLPVLVLLASGCDKSGALLAPYRDKALANIAVLEKIGQEPLPATTGTIDASGLDLRDDTVLIYSYPALASLTDDTVDDRARIDPYSRPFGYGAPIRWMKQGKIDGDKAWAKQYGVPIFKQLAELQAVIVTSEVAYQPGRVTGSLDQGAFETGELILEVHVFDLTGKYRGGFRYSTLNSPVVKVYLDSPQASLERNIRDEARLTLFQTLRAMVPASQLGKAAASSP